MFYGNKLRRVSKEAARLIREEPDKFWPPEGNLIWTQEEILKLTEEGKRI